MPGELAMRGTTLFSGYWQADDTNALVTAALDKSNPTLDVCVVRGQHRLQEMQVYSAVLDKPPPIAILKPFSSLFSIMVINPTSLVRTSMSLFGGIAMPILNFLGR